MIFVAKSNRVNALAERNSDDKMAGLVYRGIPPPNCANAESF
jgi:hypothetical protein